MDMVTSFIVKSFIASGVLYLYYQVALKNKEFHSYNRFYLLLSIVISLLVPFINFRWLYIEESQNPASYFVSIMSSPADGHRAVFSGFILFGITGFISLLLLILLASRIVRIYRIKRTNRNTKMKGFTLIETGVRGAPFSFLSNLFWKHGLSLTDASGERIFKHELTHIIQKHTYDKLVAQVVFCIFWMNPFYWLIQRELNTIHEFIADAASVEAGDTEAFAKMLLYSHNEGSYLSPSHSFYNSSIKRRLIMISLSEKAKYSYFRRILALPITLFVLTVLSINVRAGSEAKTNFVIANKTQQSFEDTIPGTSKQNLEPVTVTGHKIGVKSDKESGTEPITVTGYKIGLKSDKESRTEPITVTGYKIGLKSDKKASLEPITVTGHKID